MTNVFFIVVGILMLAAVIEQHRANKSPSGALCVTALVGTVALAGIDGHGGKARWGRSSPEMGEWAAVRR